MGLTDSPSFEAYDDGELRPVEPEPSPPILRYVIGLLLALVVVLFAVMMLRGGGISGNRYGAISGIVVDQNNVPLSAEVFILSSARSVWTNEDGSFLLESVPEGEQLLLVGYISEADSYPVSITSGETLEMGVISIDTQTRETE